MAGPLAGIDLLGRGIKAGAKALDYEIPKDIEPFLTPVSSAKNYLTGKVEEALGVPKDTIAAATDLKGFAGNVLKDTAKDYFKDKGEIPEEDRSFASADSGSGNYDSSGKYYDDEGLSTTAMKRGGKVKSAAKSKVSTASRRGDGIAQRGKTRGRML
jgi:hypothetical protein